MLDATTHDGHTPILAASYNGYLGVVVSLVDAGAKLDCPSVHGTTPLHEATRNGHLSVVMALIRAGENPCARLDQGESPLYTAAVGDFVDMSGSCYARTSTLRAL